MKYFLPYQQTRMSQSSAIAAFQCGLVSPKGTREGEEYWSSDCSHPLWWASRKFRIGKTQDSWDAYERDDFSEPRRLHLPIHRKVLNSLTWDIWFSLINNNLLAFRLTYPLLQNFYITWLLSSPPWSSFHKVTWPAVCQVWSPKNSHWIKRNSQESACMQETRVRSLGWEDPLEKGMATHSSILV